MDELGEVAGSGGQLYWGNHDEFVKSVKWLANDTVLDFINGRAVELRLLEMMDQHFSESDTVYVSAPAPERRQFLDSTYKIAYVKYPESTINKMRSFMTSGNFGVSLMVADNVARGEGLYIQAKDANWAAPMGMPEDIDPNSKVRFDSANHNYYFSNPVRIEDIITDATPMGEDLLLTPG